MIIYVLTVYRDDGDCVEETPFSDHEVAYILGQLAITDRPGWRFEIKEKYTK